MSDLHTQNKVTAQPNHFTSLRGFLAALDQMNDLHEVRREVDTDLEIGAIIRRTHETYAPAPLFTNIRGHAGYRVVGAARDQFAPRRPGVLAPAPSTLHDMIDQTVGRVLDLFEYRLPPSFRQMGRMTVLSPECTPVTTYPASAPRRLLDARCNWPTPSPEPTCKR